jgi:aminocarboxymuconate-semialdehyde decarboxylase
LIFGGVLERLPKLRFNFAHGGGSFPYTCGRISHGYNVRPDLCAIGKRIKIKKKIIRWIQKNI